LDGGQTVKIEAWFAAIATMHIANAHRQGIDTRLRDKVGSLSRVSKLGFVFRHGQAILCPGQTAQLGFDHRLALMRQRHHGTRKSHILFIREMRSVCHH
jgi:hypothetical protein